MQDLINKILFYIKVVLLLVAFSFLLYISFMRIDYFNKSIISILPLFIPFLVLLVFSVFSFFFNKGNNNLFYNLDCVMSFIAMIIIALRTMFDYNIIYSKSIINYDFFTVQETRIKVLLYLLLIGNILVLYCEKKKILKLHI